MRAPLISVVVCTYRRPQLIERFLPLICVQELPGADYEVIVIDNNSGDRTRDVVAALQRSFPHLRYFLEPRQGLARARNRGWQQARGVYMAYVDDDCRVPPGWLAVAKRVIDEHAPAEFGGPILGFYDGKPPRWWRDAYAAEHSHRYAESAGYLAIHQEIYGGNLFLQRRALAKAGGFDPRLGMRGKRLGYGEEWDLHRRLVGRRAGHRAYYEPRLFLDHLVRADKLSVGRYFREKLSRGRFTHLIGCRGLPNYTLAQSLWLPLRVAAEWVRAAWCAGLRRDRKVHRYWRNYIYENNDLNRYMNKLGQLRAQWENAPRWRRRGAQDQPCACRLGMSVGGSEAGSKIP